MAISKKEYQERMDAALARLTDQLNNLQAQMEAVVKIFIEATTELAKAWNGLMNTSKLSELDETSMLSLIVDYDSDIWKELEEEAGSVIEGWKPAGGQLNEQEDDSDRKERAT